jgi:two-component system nitrogen regulation sensor histidine kinase NtrY
MDYRSAAPATLTCGLALRAVLITALLFAGIALVSATHLYATALIALAAAAVAITDLSLLIRRASQPVAYSDDSRARIGTQHDLQYAQTLLDTVSAVLIVIGSDGRVTLANRAAHRFAGAPVGHFEQITAIGPVAARSILALSPGARQIVRVADGQSVLTFVSQLSVPGSGPQRLISLQRIAGELDAVELKAWQDMARVLAHEMMNSLTPIASLTESLETILRRDTDAAARSDGSVPAASNGFAEVAGALEAIKRRSVGLMSFVDRYRQVTELPSPSIQRVQAARLVENIDRLLSATFTDAGIDYHSNVMPADLSFCADPALLEQAIINLLSNAIDAVRRIEHPRIELACERVETQVRFTVSDNGHRLEAAVREQIFVPFFTTKPRGSGIGLSLVRHIALAHEGRLDLDVREPQGLIFSLWLPLS